MSMSNAVKNYVCELTGEQTAQLRELLQTKGWQLDTIPYAHWRGRMEGTTVVAYQSGKLTVQGAGTADFVQFLLEPEVLRTARFGYEKELAEIENPAMFEPHAGIDESGKGDFFGPLVIACCYTDADSARSLLEAGVTDSKAVSSDKKIMFLADQIRKVCAGRFSLVAIGPEAYNRLYESFGNLNRLLAWGHAKALENLLEKVPDCPRAISDQFSNPRNVLQALQERGRGIKLEQHPKAEADIAVAAASILAREEFVRRLEQLGKTCGMKLPKGAGPQVLECGRKLVSTAGKEILPKVCKMHFKTAQEILA
jgi:ribonuclease HIII